MSEALRLEEEGKQNYRPRYGSSGGYNQRGWNRFNRNPQVSSPASYNYNGNNRNGGNKFAINQNNNNNHNGPVPMELGNVQNDSVGMEADSELNLIGKLTDEERKKCREKGLCFRCRQPGHMISKCPKHTNQHF